MIVEIPFPVSTGAADVKERLKEQGDKRIFQILSTLDNAELRIFDSGNAAPNLIARIKTFRDELKDWRKQISSGDFEIKEIMPFEGFENRFPSGRRAEPFSNKEPEYFRQIFLNPEQDIPFLLEALHRLEFIDEEQQWRVTQYPNPLGPIVALIEFTKHTFLHNLDRAQYERAFCERFIIKRPAKGFEPKNRPFKISKTKMIKYLEQHF
ncbi:MAG: hypothetical protein IPM81_04250 [Saprospirales bacterium]|nr:hypothetical protein [Saprospirales bacterium]